MAEDAADRAPDTRFPSRSTSDLDAQVQLLRLDILTASPTNIGSYYGRVARPKTTSTTTASSSPRLAYAYAGPLEPWAVRIVRGGWGMGWGRGERGIRAISTGSKWSTATFPHTATL